MRVMIAPCSVVEKVGAEVGEAPHTTPGIWWGFSTVELINMTGAHEKAQRYRFKDQHNSSWPYTASYFPFPVWLYLQER